MNSVNNIGKVESKKHIELLCSEFGSLGKVFNATDLFFRSENVNKKKKKVQSESNFFVYDKS